MSARKRQERDIVHRYEGNPIIEIEDLKFRCSDIRNAGTAVVNGETLLLVSVEGLTGVQSVHRARVGHLGRYVVEEEPFLGPDAMSKYGEHASGGVTDARITYMDGVYYIMFLAYGDHGFRLGLARTADFRKVEHLGLISEPDTKAGALFPRKIKGRYARLERPREGQSIWVSYSDDLKYWGGWKPVLSPRGGHWDSSRLGTACPPIEIEQGWLLIYYGTRVTSAGPIYRLGAAILEHDSPARVVGRANIAILAPRERYERIGDVPNVVFCTGSVIGEDGSLRLYYGGSNSCICIGDTTLDEVVSICFEEGKA